MFVNRRDVGWSLAVRILDDRAQGVGLTPVRACDGRTKAEWMELVHCAVSRFDSANQSVST